MRPALAVFITLFFYVSCVASGNSPQPSSGNADSAALPSLAEVEERAASGLFYSEPSGFPPYMLSPEAETGGDFQSITLPALEGGTAWAVFMFLCGDTVPTAVELELKCTGGPAYVALTNYVSGCWEMQPPTAGGVVRFPMSAANLKLHAPGYYRTFVAVLAYDGAEVSCKRLNLDAAAPDVHWTSYVVDDEGYSGSQLKLFTSEAGASYLVYLNEQKPDLKYAQCPSGLPTAAEDWEIQDMTSTYWDAPAKAPLDARLVDGRPAVLWTRETEGADKLMLSWSEAALPQGYSDWHHSLIDVSGPFRPHVSLCDISGAPVAAFSREFTGTQLAYISVISLDQATVALTDVSFYDTQGPVLLALSDRLLIGLLRGTGLELAVSTDLHPMGQGDWQVTGGYSGFDSETEYELRLDGQGGLQMYGLGRLYSSASLNPQTGDWASSRVLAGGALGMADGRPVIAGRGPSTNQVICAWARSQNPQSGADWIYSVIEDEIEAPFVAVAEIDGKPVVAYMDGHSGTVKFAFMQ